MWLEIRDTAIQLEVIIMSHKFTLQVHLLVKYWIIGRRGYKINEKFYFNI